MKFFVGRVMAVDRNDHYEWLQRWIQAVIEPASYGVVLNVRVIPRAPASRIAGARGDALLVRLTAAPVDGAANAALIDLLASVLQIPKSAISITAGKTSRNKRVKIVGLDQTQIEARLRRATS